MLNFNNFKMKYLVVVILLLPMLVSAQNNPDVLEEEKTFALGVVPQFAIANGFRIDLDFRLNEKNHWLVVAPLMYISSKPNLDWDYNSMAGGGVEIQHKIFMKKEFTDINPYFSYGTLFSFYSVKDDGLAPQEFSENGGNYIGLVEDEITTNIFKIGGNLIFGLHFLIMDNFYLDSYIGTGIRFSFDDKTSGLHDYYNEWWGDMGYSGTLMVGGFRFGVMF
jgi:hypothetical protein